MTRTLLALILAQTAWLASASAQVVTMVAEINDHMVGQPTGSPATGIGILELDPDANTLEYYIRYSGLIGTEVASHFHGIGAGFPVIEPLPPTNPKVGVWNYPESVEANLLAGIFYINIHTDLHVGGEIAGFVVQVPDTVAAECFGTACPCGNDDPSAGCTNSTGAGALLSFTGTGSVAHDHLVLTASGLPPNAIGLVFVGPPVGRTPFGDGLLCAEGASAMRFPTHSAGMDGVFVEGPGMVDYSRENFAPGAEIAVGATLSFQAWYRDAAGPCGSSANTTNAVLATFSF